MKSEDVNRWIKNTYAHNLGQIMTEKSNIRAEQKTTSGLLRGLSYAIPLSLILWVPLLVIIGEALRC